MKKIKKGYFTMKHTVTKLLALLLALAMLFSLAACTQPQPGNTNNEGDGNTPNDATTEPNKDLEIKVYALSGTTALGLAQMMANADHDTMNYQISLHAAADTVTAPVLKGECAIAALPTNVAVKLYHQSEGKIQLLALNTLGVLYLLQAEGQSITSLDDLRGKTVYLPGSGSNPEYITAALLEKAGLVVGTDVILDTTTYQNPDALQAAMIAGKAPLAVLPEPKVSVVTTKAPTITAALDLTEEWEKQFGENTLVQGCLVVNTEFAKAHPAEIKQFLADYKASVEFIKAGSEEAIDMIVKAAILPSAAIAGKALPKCNLCYFAGNDMKAVMNAFCRAIYDQNEQSIKAMPVDAFYYVAS